MIIKKIVIIFLLSSATGVFYSKGSEFTKFIKGYRPSKPYNGQTMTIVDHYSITFKILKREIKEATVPILLQRVKKNKNDYFTQKGKDWEGGPYMIPILLTITKRFNSHMNDVLAAEIWTLVAQKEAEPDFRSEKTTKITSSGIKVYFSERMLDACTSYRPELVNGISSIVCTTSIIDQHLIDEAIKAVEEE